MVLIVLLVLGQGAFCGGSKDSGGTAAGKETAITFWNGFTASDGDILREIYDRFNKENTKKIKVAMDIMPWANMLEKLAVSVSTKTGPTLILLGIENIPEYSQSGGILPLDDFWTRSGLNKANYAQNVLETFTYKGGTYGIPMQYNTHYLYWNKDLFKEAGLDPDRPPKTISELKEYAKKLTKPEKEQYGFGFPADSVYITNFLWSNGGDWLTRDNKRSAFNSSTSVEVLRMLQDFAKMKATPLGMSGGDLDNLLYAGKLAMYMNGPWLINGCRQKGLNFGIDSIPAADNGNKQFAGTGVAFMVTSSANAEQKTAAYECIKYWLSKDVLKEWTLRNGVPAWSQEVIDDQDVKNDPIQKVLGPLSAHGRVPFAEMPESGQIIADYLNPLFEQLVYQKITPESCAQKMEEGINTVLGVK
jgi:multiple sugar transport system substrate-binding protein